MDDQQGTGAGALDETRLDALFDAIQTALSRLRGARSLDVGELDREQRERITGLLEDLTVESRRVLETFGARCPFCRTAPAEMVGVCEKCGGDACTNCATVYQGVILHRGTCALFYGGTPDT